MKDWNMNEEKNENVIVEDSPRREQFTQARIIQNEENVHLLSRLGEKNSLWRGDWVAQARIVQRGVKFY